MEIMDGLHASEEVNALIRGKVEVECFMCMGEFDCGEYVPMIMCMNQHSCCAPCMQQLLKNDNGKLSCPHCNQPILKKAVTKNRLLVTIYELIAAFKRHVASLEDELQLAKKVTLLDPKASLLSKNPKLVNSFILSQQKSTKFLGNSTLFDDSPMHKSQTWTGNIEKRRETILTYAERQKIEQLKKIAKSDMPLEQVTSIRSGYGSIKKIECMEYFINLRELLLYNNHIKVIEGLNSNIKLNVLSLAYNKIEKVENIGHLKELKRLSLQCNKIGRSSADYLSHYDWKTLESLTISFHEQKKEDNEACLAVLFGSTSAVQWSSLKTLYIYNSKTIPEKSRNLMREFTSKRKNAFQIYWS